MLKGRRGFAIIVCLKPSKQPVVTELGVLLAAWQLEKVSTYLRVWGEIGNGLPMEGIAVGDASRVHYEVAGLMNW